MTLARRLLTLIVAAISTGTVVMGDPQWSPPSQHPIGSKHTIIRSHRTFEETRATLEASIPPLNTTYSTLLAAGDIAGALAALEALPPLNNFVASQRDFGRLLQVVGESGKAVQYEIGNPLTATRLNWIEIRVALYVPIRVLLRVDSSGEVAFEYDQLEGFTSRFRNREVNDIAGQLDRNLTRVLLEAAGWLKMGQLGEL
ncbi:Uu.00g145950.m01.CDS01 [Anthostomella pinea]|uniref:Uu.00g145950.m01.CDS01 n=1 Tax=Anthostomella pinea TaxID=933095 RepID=A0AAI8VRZ2_9PEZI|nr:Uu.00g145950.m01.CDS01 [Anthostomella pinea]